VRLLVKGGLFQVAEGEVQLGAGLALDQAPGRHRRASEGGVVRGATGIGQVADI
jgi:hypothetical protein